MTKKIRLIDEEPVAVEETESGSAHFTKEQAEQVMKYLEAIDWKLWELLKEARGEK